MEKLYKYDRHKSRYHRLVQILLFGWDLLLVNLRIKQCGEMIPKILHLRVKVDTPIINVFDIIHPPMKFKLENILTFINSVFYLGVKKNEDQDTTGRWFLSGTRVSSTNKTNHHEITEILLKVPLNTINLNPNLLPPNG
jgi:hypothetical protein